MTTKYVGGYTPIYKIPIPRKIHYEKCFLLFPKRLLSGKVKWLTTVTRKYIMRDDLGFLHKDIIAYYTEEEAFLECV